MRYLIFFILFPVFSFPGTSQAQSDCGAQLRQVFIDARTALQAVPGHAIVTKIDVSTTFPEARSPSSHEVITLSMGNGRTIVANEKFSLFEDAQARVVLLPLDSAVYVYDKMEKKAHVEDALRWLKEIDLIQMKGTVASCRRTKLNGHDLLEVSYSLPAHGETNMMKVIGFRVDKTSKQPLQVTIQYHPGAKYASQDFKYLEYSLGKLDDRLKKPSTSLVMAKNGLRSAYSGFQLYDLRQHPTTHVDR